MSAKLPTNTNCNAKALELVKQTVQGNYINAINALTRIKQVTTNKVLASSMNTMILKMQKALVDARLKRPQNWGSDSDLQGLESFLKSNCSKL